MSGEEEQDTARLEYSSALPLGYVDIFVFSSFLGLLFYWFFIRKSKQAEIQPTVAANG
jgi:hypothetical protein